MYKQFYPFLVTDHLFLLCPSSFLSLCSTFEWETQNICVIEDPASVFDLSFQFRSQGEEPRRGFSQSYLFVNSWVAWFPPTCTMTLAITFLHLDSKGHGWRARRWNQVPLGCLGLVPLHIALSSFHSLLRLAVECSFLAKFLIFRGSSRA